jgi:hypothetical protein
MCTEGCDDVKSECNFYRSSHEEVIERVIGQYRFIVYMQTLILGINEASI